MQGFFASSIVQKKSPNSLLPRCGACGLFKGCQTPKMPVYGKGKLRVLIVGEVLSEGDDELERPFTGPNGDFLRDCLDEIGIDLDRDCWQTNALICHPTKPIEEANIDYCRPNITQAIAELAPAIVVTLGRGGLSAVLKPYWHDIGPLARWIGWQMPLEKHWLCPTYSPAWIRRQKSPVLEKLFLKDLENAFDLHKPSKPLRNLKQVVERLYDPPAIIKAIDDLEEMGGWVAFDYEGNCLKPEYPKAKIFSCSISNGHRTIAYPWTGDAITRTGEFLASDKTRKIASNLKFEERWTRKTFGHGVRRWGWDTMIAAHVIDSREGITSLKFQSLIKLGVPTYNENIEPYLKSGDSKYNRIGEIAVTDLLLYNGIDSFLEFHLARRQRKEMQYED